MLHRGDELRQVQRPRCFVMLLLVVLVFVLVVFVLLVFVFVLMLGVC